MPKGIVATEANLLADCLNICATMDIRPDDINLGAIPMSHSYGFSNLVTPLLVQGTAVVISNDYLPQSVVDLCNRFSLHGRAADSDGVRSSDHRRRRRVRDRAHVSLRRRAAAARRCRAGSASASASPIHTFYGCSECGGITYDREGAAVERGTVGQAMENVTLVVRTRTAHRSRRQRRPRLSARCDDLPAVRERASSSPTI